MRKFSLFIAGLCLLQVASSQPTLVNTGEILYIGAEATVQINGDFKNEAGGNFINNGTVTITGKITNDQVMNSYTGKLVLKGSSAQHLDGLSDMLTKHFEINNAAGLTLNSRLKVDGICEFTNGIITTGSTATPLWFTPGATAKAAKDNSHVHGFVVKEGTGSFEFPVGDETRYQRVGVNLSGNSSGLRVRYYGSDAGTGNFTATGTEPVALVSYNKNEYWEVYPLTNASGTISIFWDGYKDAFGNIVGQRKVAHQAGGNWLNEGTNGTGTTGAGSVTSNNLVNWGLFTLGSISMALPVTWLYFEGRLNQQQRAVLQWKVQESNVLNYEVQKSADGISFTGIGTQKSLGEGEHAYQLTEPNALSGTAYYRVLQADRNGAGRYSRVIALSTGGSPEWTVFPNPFRQGFTITVSKPETASLFNMQGQLIRRMQVSAGANYIEGNGLTPGTYLLQVGTTVPARKIIKE